MLMSQAILGAEEIIIIIEIFINSFEDNFSIVFK